MFARTAAAPDNSQTSTIPVDQPAGELTYYGVPKRQLVNGWPSTSGVHDHAYNFFLNGGGLVGPWSFFTERITVAGRWFLLATASFFGYGTSSLELPGYAPLAYASALWFVALLAMRFCRPRVELTARHSERICAGEMLPVEIEIEQKGRYTGNDMRVRAHRLPPLVEVESVPGIVVPPLAPGKTTRLHVNLRCPHRGVWRLRGYRVETDFPFGLLLTSRVFEERKWLLVYPNFTRLTRLQLPTGRRHHPGGVALAASRGESFEFFGNREFREGDSIRAIDWRATARLNKPIVREYREEYFLRVAVVLDTHVPNAKDKDAVEAFERGVSVCAAVGDYMAAQDYLVDIFAAGPNLYHLTAGLSLAYLDQILDILACVDSNPAEPFETLESELFEHLAQITTVICVFLDWNENRRDFVHRLSSQGAAVKVIIVRDEACTLDPAVDGDILGEVPIIDAARFAAGVEQL